LESRSSPSIRQFLDVILRRYFVPPFFGFWDSRALDLETPAEGCDEPVRLLHLKNKAKLIDELKHEYGAEHIEHKIRNFQEVGTSPMSIVSYHNLFFWHARKAFVAGAYYPALTSACALGERILNHLILDLREHFRSANSFKIVCNKQSIDDWHQAVHVLNDWNVLEPGVPELFKKLKTLRNNSIHFNLQTPKRAREDALRALQILKEIITYQFGSFGTQRWFIRGTKGACLIKKEAETDPFVKTFYLKQCPLLGYRYALRPLPSGAWLAFDQEFYEETTLTDEEFCCLYNNRKISDLASDDLPPRAGIVTWLLVTGEASRVKLEAAPRLG
jgi:hypothetical protein